MLQTLLSTNIRMQSYQDLIDQNIQAFTCPFCEISNKETIDENADFKVILARAPYTPDHLLIIPHRHLIYMHQLSSQELDSAMQLIKKRMDKLHLTYPDVNLLLRDGTVGGNIGKSVDHLHFHLIPSITLGGQISKMRHRAFFSDSQYQELIKDFKSQFISQEKPFPIRDISYGTIPYIQEPGQEPDFLLIYQKEKFRGFPKGHREAGESPEQTILRELKEETWISDCVLHSDHEPLEISYTFTHQNQKITKTAIFQLWKLSPESKNTITIDQNEVLDYARCTYDQAIELLTHQNSKELLKKAYEIIKENNALKAWN